MFEVINEDENGMVRVESYRGGYGLVGTEYFESYEDMIRADQAQQDESGFLKDTVELWQDNPDAHLNPQQETNDAA